MGGSFSAIIGSLRDIKGSSKAIASRMRGMSPTRRSVGGPETSFIELLDFFGILSPGKCSASYKYKLYTIYIYIYVYVYIIYIYSIYIYIQYIYIYMYSIHNHTYRGSVPTCRGFGLQPWFYPELQAIHFQTNLLAHLTSEVGDGDGVSVCVMLSYESRTPNSWANIVLTGSFTGSEGLHLRYLSTFHKGT